MWDLLTGDPNRLRVALLYVLPICLTVLAATAIKAWRMNEAHKRDHELKLEMLAHGMSAEQIADGLGINTNGAATDPARLAETLPYVKN
ncbi:MAG TPA: hypothetical protein VH107_14105 [Lacipirellulaceae bacterium]|jgi:hypothetical protein|nr:hypothetical protein [Lacipirellulaceae bacterium]